MKTTDKNRIEIIGDGETSLFNCDSDNEAIHWVNLYTRYDWGGYSTISVMGLDDPDGPYLIAEKRAGKGWIEID